jgi:hypothetical protein
VKWVNGWKLRLKPRFGVARLLLGGVGVALRGLSA